MTPTGERQVVRNGTDCSSKPGLSRPRYPKSLLELAAERRAFGVEAVDLVLEILEAPLGVGPLDGLEDLGASR